MSSIKKIAVIGGGISGLLCCYALAVKGFEIILVDNEDFRDIPTNDQRAIVLSEASKIILQSIGLWQKIQPFSIPIKEVWVSEKKVFGRIKFNANELGLGALGWSICAQDLFMIISKAVLEKPNVVLKMKRLFEDFRTSENILSLELVDGSTEQVKNVDFIVGADGFDSKVRRKMRLHVTRKDYNQDAVVGNVVTTVKNTGVAIQKIFQHGSLALIPSGDYHYTFIFIVKKGFFKNYYKNKKALLDLIIELCGFPFGRYCSLEVCHDYSLFGSKVFYRHLKKFALVGNSRGTIHPSTAQGLNLGIRDIDELISLLNSDENFYNKSKVSKSKQFLSSRKSTEIFADLVALFYGERYLTTNFIRRVTIAAVATSRKLRKQFGRIGTGIDYIAR
ncbi:MAG: hypothetical protein CBC29_03640 [Methylococcaceae bacterium TMED69]|nr:MAG: hypothetical protein CBC29_03640 [Methylococcaceae bacterium TMED69]|tara:strand:+ start:637 stop:1809 length:1173 start_codon:yes stop_codon:yes gene_type:complete